MEQADGKGGTISQEPRAAPGALVLQQLKVSMPPVPTAESRGWGLGV